MIIRAPVWKRNGGTLNSALLFTQVERFAQSKDATEDDKRDYQILNDLRAKQLDRENIVSKHTLPGAWTFAEPLQPSLAAARAEVSSPLVRLISSADIP